MARFWASRTGWRAAIAVAAAYAVTLQVLLASIAPAQLLSHAISSAGDSILCQGDPAAAPENPAPSHQPNRCPPCILSSLASALTVLPGSSWLVPTAIMSFFPPPTTAAVVAARHPTPRLSQGPPDSA